MCDCPKKAEPAEDAERRPRPLLSTTKELIRQALARHEQELARILSLDAQDQQIKPDEYQIDLQRGLWIDARNAPTSKPE